MKINRMVLTLGVWLFASVPAPALAGEAGPAEGLQRNPFVAPQREVIPALPPSPPAAAEAPLKLRATLVAGRDSVANINGTLLAPGERFNGYRLLQVGEGEAVLERQGRRITLLVDAGG